MNGPERPVEFMVRFCGEFLYLSQIQHHVWIVLKPYTVNLGTLVGIQVRQKDNMLELPVRYSRYFVSSFQDRAL